MDIEEISEPVDRVRAAPPRHVLDQPTWASLTGPHARFAERRGRAVRYRPDVSPFVALEDPADEACWADAARLAGPSGSVVLLPGPLAAPPGWRRVFGEECLQLVESAVIPLHDPEAVRLGPEDVPEILDLISRTRPGPFLPRTIELGTYLGIRRDGALVALAGERQRPPGWTEVSAVCTDPAYRRQGLAARLVRAVVAGVRERGEQAYLAVLASNPGAIRVYESLGFTLRSRGWVSALELL